MKLQDFGLWFLSPYNGWSSTIPKRAGFWIYYDGVYLGSQASDFIMSIYTESWHFLRARTHIVKLKNKFRNDSGRAEIGCLLTLDDFEIVPNPNYKGTV